MNTRSTENSLLYLWNLRTLYIGEAFQLSQLTPPAASLLVGIDGEIEIQEKHCEKVMRSRVFLVPPGVTFRAKSFGRKVVTVYLDPVRRDFFLLSRIMRHSAGSIFFDSDNEEQMLVAFTEILDSEPPPAEAYRLLCRDVFPDPLMLNFTYEVDPRVWQVIDLIKRHPLSNLGSDYMAEQIDLSEVQLRRLFKRTTGIALRRYRRWHRLFITASYMALGNSLTDAAYAAGFSDSSHFCHTFSEMLGMKPSFVLKNAKNIKIFIGQEDSY